MLKLESQKCIYLAATGQGLFLWGQKAAGMLKKRLPAL